MLQGGHSQHCGDHADVEEALWLLPGRPCHETLLPLQALSHAAPSPASIRITVQVLDIATASNVCLSSASSLCALGLPGTASAAAIHLNDVESDDFDVLLWSLDIHIAAGIHCAAGEPKHFDIPYGHRSLDGWTPAPV